ncbi:MAG: Txe/YoeB family addiction module toxin [Verrucomicrobiales bacterium]|nr:Txe/YoeB family addiction module toxin [Verrucomicrobiales bacterium]|tara:strand:- start:110 stop:370 length:261 start_codon:yes stop_codon:yes gene_type:complete
MKIVFSEQTWEDYQFWVVNDRKTLKRINQLIRDTARDPFSGVGKPEPLRHLLKGYWSRRINEEHRMVYCVKDDQLMLAQLRYHYER